MKLRELKKHGVDVKEEVQATTVQKKQRRTSKGFQVPVGKINEILKHATKQDLTNIKRHWADMIEQLNIKHMRSQAALLKEAEPVAASSQAIVIKFKYEIHCQMAMENAKFIDTVSSILFYFSWKSHFQIVGVPEDQWLKVREGFLNNQRDQNEASEFGETEEDPLIAEARKLVGDDLIEIME